MILFLGKAGNGIRTRDIKLGKLALYQLSYARTSAYRYGSTNNEISYACQWKNVQFSYRDISRERSSFLSCVSIELRIRKVASPFVS